MVGSVLNRELDLEAEGLQAFACTATALNSAGAVCGR